MACSVVGQLRVSERGNKAGEVYSNLRESEIIKIWQQLVSEATDTPLVTEGGEHIRIIYPGRINDDRGADFRDAVIATSRRVVKGDIEVHVKSSDWQAHRHHCDPVYNRVILHVVMWQKQNYLVPALSALLSSLRTCLVEPALQVV